MKRKLVEWDEGWNYIQKGITKLKRIMEGLPETPFSADEYMLLYTVVYNMCTQNSLDYSHQLYYKYKETIEQYITSKGLPSLREKHGKFMLQEFVNSWERHKVMVKWLSDFFQYLNRHFIHRTSLPALEVVGFNCFRDLVYREVNANVRAAVIALIDKEREGEKFDGPLFKTVTDVFVEIGRGQMDTYKEDFEAHMLKNTDDYYSRKASCWIVKDSFSDYIVKANECVRRERDIVSHYLHSSSEQNLVERVQHELFEPLANAFKRKASVEVNTLVQKAENAASNQPLKGASVKLEHDLVRDIVELHGNYMAYVDDCLINNHLFHNALREAFDIFCNKAVAGKSSAQLLSVFCDNILKKGESDKLSDEAIEGTLDKVVGLLAYVTDKGLFAELYRKKFVRRLLFDRSARKEHEKSMLIKMKCQCGGLFTSKLEGMITDLTLAWDNQTSFEEYLHNNPTVHPGMGLTVTVLTPVYWPSFKSCDLSLPAEMVKCVEVFKGFYKTKKKCRKLTWIYSLGTCHITGKFEQKEIELVVSTYQAALLLLFNAADRLSYSEILSTLNLTHDAGVRILHSLSCGKYKILIKSPNTNTVSRNDNFEFNSKFTDRMRRINIPLSPVEEKEVIVDVEKDMWYHIDAAIVRIMKNWKVLGHQQLVMECVDLLGDMFKPEIRAIKKRIDNLISREYLERDMENHSIYKYIV